MPIPISNPGDYARPAADAFTPDRLGVRQVNIDVDRLSGIYKVWMTPCPATATVWGPVDAPRLVSPDLVAEILAAPASAERTAALAAVQQIADALVTVGAFLLARRSGA